VKEGVRSRPVSVARTRAEEEWRRLCGESANVVPLRPRLRREARHAARI
jgi:hypothetical protein